MTDNLIPVFVCESADYDPAQKPDGFVHSKREAARLIRRIIAERDGDMDTGITAANVIYVGGRYFIGD